MLKVESSDTVSTLSHGDDEVCFRSEYNPIPLKFYGNSAPLEIKGKISTIIIDKLSLAHLSFTSGSFSLIQDHTEFIPTQLWINLSITLIEITNMTLIIRTSTFFIHILRYKVRPCPKSPNSGF